VRRGGLHSLGDALLNACGSGNGCRWLQRHHDAECDALEFTRGTAGADVEEALRTCGWPTDTAVGWSGHATLSDLGLSVTAGDVEGRIIVTAQALTDLPEGYPPQDPPVRWFCAIPDSPAEIGSDFVFGPVPAGWDAPHRRL